MPDPGRDRRFVDDHSDGLYSSSHSRQVLYGWIVFLSSAIVMVLEISAGRLIAPYVGVSLYSWTSIIGVVLAGLSLGNWVGGRWADMGASEREVGVALSAAVLATLGVLLALTLVQCRAAKPDFCPRRPQIDA